MPKSDDCKNFCFEPLFILWVTRSNRSEHLLLEFGRTIHFGAGIFTRSFSVKFHQLLQVELGGLEDLDLADENVLQRENSLGSLFNFLAHHFGDTLRRVNDEDIV